MINRLIIIILLMFGFSNSGYSNEENCNDLNKFSVDYVKCKANLVKKKTISAGKSFVEDTKEYQKKEWSEEKRKVDKIKKKVLGE